MMTAYRGRLLAPTRGKEEQSSHRCGFKMYSMLYQLAPRLIPPA